MQKIAYELVKIGKIDYLYIELIRLGEVSIRVSCIA
jgi:hypothetical protein